MYRLYRFVLILSFSVFQITHSQATAESQNNKKDSFFKSIYPLVEKENISILRTRDKIISIKQKLKSKQILIPSESTLLIVLANKYQLLKYRDNTNVLVDKLLNRIDIIPPSLALAQSANESAWGTSRFARQANNYFGQWCFSKGCGIIPNQRPANSSHEVKNFSSIQNSVRSYIKNINSTRAYANLRKIRSQLRLKNHSPDGLKLAQGLLKYSSRGIKYVNEIRSMIKQNKLIAYDQRFWALMKKIKLDRSI